MATVTIKKKNVDPLKQALDALKVPDIYENFPTADIEPWRRVDLKSLSSLFAKAAGSGVRKHKINWKTDTIPVYKSETDKRATHHLKTLAEWRKEDPHFAAKVDMACEQVHIPSDRNFFTDLSDRLTDNEDTYVLRIHENIAWDKPAYIVCQPFDESYGLFLDKLLIYGEKNSNAKLFLERYTEGFSVSQCNVYAEENSNIELHTLLREGPDRDTRPAWVGYQNFIVKKYATVKQGVYSAGGKSGKLLSHADLDEDATMKTFGFHVGNYSKVDHEFSVNQRGSRSHSDLLFKMALMNEAFGVFQGNIMIPENTRGCIGHQQNKNLILGENSRADAIPRLEILTEDVECSHGSATGELEDDELFYLMSRGLDADETRHLMLLGFFEDILQKALSVNTEEHHPYLHDIWCAIQDRMRMYFDRSYMHEETP